MWSRLGCSQESSIVVSLHYDGFIWEELKCLLHRRRFWRFCDEFVSFFFKVPVINFDSRAIHLERKHTALLLFEEYVLFKSLSSIQSRALASCQCLAATFFRVTSNFLVEISAHLLAQMMERWPLRVVGMGFGVFCLQWR